jgi:hypothetical protein
VTWLRSNIFCYIEIASMLMIFSFMYVKYVFCFICNFNFFVPLKLYPGAIFRPSLKIMTVHFDFLSCFNLVVKSLEFQPLKIRFKLVKKAREEAGGGHHCKDLPRIRSK